MTTTTCGDVLLELKRRKTRQGRETTDLVRKVVKVNAEVISVANEGQARVHEGGEDIRDQSDGDQESSELEGLLTSSFCERGCAEFLESEFGVVQLQSVLSRRGKHVVVVMLIWVACGAVTLAQRRSREV